MEKGEERCPLGVNRNRGRGLERGGKGGPGPLGLIGNNMGQRTERSPTGKKPRGEQAENWGRKNADGNRNSWERVARILFQHVGIGVDEHETKTKTKLINRVKFRGEGCSGKKEQ